MGIHNQFPGLAIRVNKIRFYYHLIAEGAMEKVSGSG